MLRPPKFPRLNQAMTMVMAVRWGWLSLLCNEDLAIVVTKMAKSGQEAPLRQTAPVERLAEQTREWFAAAQRDSYERTRIATGLKFMWSLQREAWLRGIAQLVR